MYTFLFNLGFNKNTEKAKKTFYKTNVNELKYSIYTQS